MGFLGASRVCVFLVGLVLRALRARDLVDVFVVPEEEAMDGVSVANGTKGMLATLSRPK